jgi:flagellar basal body-associated protein FliL
VEETKTPDPVSPENESSVENDSQTEESGSSSGFSLKGVFTSIPEGFREARVGLQSMDAPTRRMSLVFFFSLFGLIAVFFAATEYLIDQKKERAATRAIEEARIAEELLQEEERKRLLEPPPYQSIGAFSLELRESETMVRDSGLRVAEMEIVLACSKREVCEWIKSNLDLSRGSLGSLFTPADRERILSPAGKKAFREEIRDTLNHLLEQKGVEGSVIEVLFPRFIMS